MHSDRRSNLINRINCTIAAVVLLASACNFERTTNVKIRGDYPPIFVLAGSGDLVEMYIYEPGFEGSLSDESHAIWKIKSEVMHGRPVEEVGTITYGVVPEDFKQIVPKNEESPMTLRSGNKYKFNVVTGNAPGVKGYFEMKDRTAVIVETWH